MAVKEEDMKESFDCYDRGKKGFVSIADLPRALGVIGINPSENEMNAIIQKYDPNMTKKITYSSYVQIVQSQEQGFTSVTGIVEAFQIFDKEGNGIISADELKHVLLNLGEKLPQEEVDELLAEADPDGSGSIYYEDFAKLLIE